MFNGASQFIRTPSKPAKGEVEDNYNQSRVLLFIYIFSVIILMRTYWNMRKGYRTLACTRENK